MHYVSLLVQLLTEQALAAIGQCRLMSIWDSLFAHMNQPVAQILLTRNDIADRSQYLNAQNTIAEVLNFGVIPIVNENDTLAVSEIKFGDNDTLSAITAAMVHADYLFLMTDVEALYNKNPRQHADAEPIKTIEDIDALDVDVSSRGSDLGTGGMATKIIAARLATSAGTTTIITMSSKPGNIKDIIRHFHPPEPKPNANGAETPSTPVIEPPLHTRFLPSPTPIRNRAFWILYGLVPQGTIYIDRGASRALHNKAGLLPVGIVDVVGDFGGQEAVRLVVVDRNTYPHPLASTTTTIVEDLTSSTSSLSTLNPSRPSSPPRNKSSTQNHPPYQGGEEVGRALSNYSAEQIHRIKGLRSWDIAKVLGYADTEYVAFRENVSLTSNTTAINALNNNHSHSHSHNNSMNLGTETGTGSGQTSTSRPATPSTPSKENNATISTPERGGSLEQLIHGRIMNESISASVPGTVTPIGMGGDDGTGVERG